jgi:co-chaperonin GroES (HSP10)
MNESFETEMPQTIAEAFPDVDPAIVPLGARVLIQLRRIPKATKSGIFLIAETQDTVRWNNQIGRVVALGPLAFRNRETRAPWAEGIWLEVGDYVRVPRWNGDRVEVPVKDSSDPVTFVVFNDHEMIAKIVGDPLAVRTYVLN